MRPNREYFEGEQGISDVQTAPNRGFGAGDVGGGSVKLQMLRPDQSTLIPVGTRYRHRGRRFVAIVEHPAGQYRFATAAATAVYVGRRNSVLEISRGELSLRCRQVHGRPSLHVLRSARGAPHALAH